MDKIFKMTKISSDGEIILEDDEFDKFINEMNLPVFKQEFKAKLYTTETLYTFFNGKTIKTSVRIVKK